MSNRNDFDEIDYASDLIDNGSLPPIEEVTDPKDNENTSPNESKDNGDDNKGNKLSKKNKSSGRKERQRRNRIKNTFKWLGRFSWIYILIMILILVIIGTNVLNKYYKTMDWEKNTNTIAMADQSLDLLYDDNEESKRAKTEFINLYKQLITTDGSLSDKVNVSTVKELKRHLDKIDLKSSEVDYDVMYAEVAMKYSLNEQFDKLFADEKRNQLKSDVTPATLAKFNNDTYPDLKLLYIMNNEDQFVINMIDDEAKFSNDVNIFNELTEVFSNAITVSGNTATFNPGYNGNISLDFNSKLRELEYKWDSTKYMSNVISLLGPTLEEIHKAYNNYAKYETDVANRDIALQSWDIEKQQFFYEVQAIRDRALAEKAERERRERIRAELEKGLPEAKDTLKEFKGLTNDEYNDYLRQLENATSMEDVNIILTNAKKRSEYNINREIEEERRKREEAIKKEEEANSEPKEENDSGNPSRPGDNNLPNDNRPGDNDNTPGDNSNTSNPSERPHENESAG